MHLGPQAQAILLLTISLGKVDRKEAKPLTIGEWSRFAVWLRDHDLQPSSLLNGAVNTQLSEWDDHTVTLDRVSGLLERGGALGLALEKWQRAGLWVVTRSDADYPERLKQRLRSKSPPALFGCGNKPLLKRGGIAVVGSRDVSENDLAFTNEFGVKAAAQGYSIVSGGARGVDQTAMLGALESEGTAIGVLSDSLFQSVTSSKYRKYIMSGDLALFSPFNPEAGFNVGNAMARNRYIYCLADAAVVVSAGLNKGGSWNGAIEDLKHHWVPLWVKENSDSKFGNQELINRGANILSDDMSDLSKLFASPGGNGAKEVMPGSLPAPQPSQAVPIQPVPISAEGEQSQFRSEIPLPDSSQKNRTLATGEPTDLSKRSFYGFFLYHMRKLACENALGVDEIVLRLEVSKPQINLWLKQAISDKKIKKLSRPVRYQWAEEEGAQASLFERD